MKRILAIVWSFLICSSCTKDTWSQIEIGALPENTASMQKQVVGQLSGKFELADGIKLSSRWSPKERALTRHYFKAIINQLELTPIEHRYRHANINFGADLLIEPFKGTNLYTVLPATIESNDYILLGAHYDSGLENGAGAIDNATGVALIYSVLRELQKVSNRKQHVMMVFFDQEEEDNVGSKAFIKLIKKKGWNITSVHCFDMVGWDGNQDDAMEIFTASKDLENKYLTLAKSMNKKLFNLVLNPVGYKNSSTDFDEFLKNGFNAIGAGECFYHRDSTPYKDTIDDTFETVNFDYLLSSTTFIETVIKNLLSEQ